MYFPRFWAKAEQDNFCSWAWSDRSETDARAQAHRKVSEIAAKARCGALGRASPYAYGNRPLREPVLEEHRGAGNEIAAIVSRNAIGCEVLNTAGLMFVDVDRPAPVYGLTTFFSRIAAFFTGARKYDSKSSLPDPLEKIVLWCSALRARNARVYETPNGFRVILTAKTFDPAGAEAREVFEALGADPAYVKLCNLQKSFRARISPKPWRCGMPIPPVKWPFQDGDQARFDEWKARYEDKARRYASCRLVRTIGEERVSPEIDALIRLHDERAQALRQLPLA